MYPAPPTTRTFGFIAIFQRRDVRGARALRPSGRSRGTVGISSLARREPTWLAAPQRAPTARLSIACRRGGVAARGRRRLQERPARGLGRAPRAAACSDRWRPVARPSGPGPGAARWTGSWRRTLGSDPASPAARRDPATRTQTRCPGLDRRTRRFL